MTTYRSCKPMKVQVTEKNLFFLPKGFGSSSSRVLSRAVKFVMTTYLTEWCSFSSRTQKLSHSYVSRLRFKHASNILRSDLKCF